MTYKNFSGKLEQNTMQYHSTLDEQQHVNFSDAIQAGLAAKGGLFVPDDFPHIDIDAFAGLISYPEFASTLLSHFIDTPISKHLPEICQRAFNFSVPLEALKNNTWMLELFHGPTLSFKDFGARFLAECMQCVTTDKPMTVLVATSGDTGSAVAAAFYQKQNIRVVVLFPEGKISERQQQQITCWGDNVLALAVQGDFDDCQRIVKSAFADEQWSTQTHLSTSNSINIGRLLPQVVYYAYTSLHFRTIHAEKLGVVVPSGNLGNVTAAYWAQKLGFPIREIVIATNANQPIINYLATGKYKAFATKQTLANAMDVGNPSNFARLEYLFPDFNEFKQNVSAIQVDDQQIKQAIKQAFEQDGIMICPHTATAYFARQQLNDEPWAVVATADPCKFPEVVEPVIGREVPIASQLVELQVRTHHQLNVSADLDVVTRSVQDYFG
jgi:threonine synthase